MVLPRSKLVKKIYELFPYGIGPKTTDSLHFYKYILSLSNPLFHRGKVTTTIHNMYERKKLLRSACFYTTKSNKIKIGELKNEDFTPEIQRLIATKDDIDEIISSMDIALSEVFE